MSISDRPTVRMGRLAVPSTPARPSSPRTVFTNRRMVLDDTVHSVDRKLTAGVPVSYRQAQSLNPSSIWFV